MMTFEEISAADRTKAERKADKVRARRDAVEAIFDMLGKAVRTEEARADVLKRLEAYQRQGVITEDELASYASTVIVRDARARVQPPVPLPEPTGRNKDVFEAVRGKSRGGAYDLSPAEFKDAWEKI